MIARIVFASRLVLWLTSALSLAFGSSVEAISPKAQHNTVTKPPAVTGSKANQPSGTPIGDKWALVIGISKFADPSVPTLKYSSKDASDFYEYLIDPSAGRFARDHVKLLIDENATKENIMDAVGDSFLPRAALPEDLVVIYLSTHGSSSGMDIRGINYVIAHDTKVNKLFSSGIEMQDFLEKIKERVHTKRIVLVLDTCFSGATGDSGHKGFIRTNVDSNHVAQGIGSLVICSSAPDQRSWESEKINNSYFTKYLIEALRRDGGKVPVEYAFSTMRERVRADVLREKGELQTPELAGKFVGPKLVLGLPPTVTRRPPEVDPKSSGSPVSSSTTSSAAQSGVTGYIEQEVVVQSWPIASSYASHLKASEDEVKNLLSRCNSQYEALKARGATSAELEALRSRLQGQIDARFKAVQSEAKSMESELEKRLKEAIDAEAKERGIDVVVRSKPLKGDAVDLTPGVIKRLR